MLPREVVGERTQSIDSRDQHIGTSSFSCLCRQMLESNDLLVENFLLPQPSSKPARAGRRANSTTEPTSTNDASSNVFRNDTHHVVAGANNRGEHPGRQSDGETLPMTMDHAAIAPAKPCSHESSSHNAYGYEPTNAGRRKRGAGSSFLILPRCEDSANNCSNCPVMGPNQTSALVPSTNASATTCGTRAANAQPLDTNTMIPQTNEPNNGTENHDPNVGKSAGLGFKFKFGAR